MAESVNNAENLFFPDFNVNLDMDLLQTSTSNGKRFVHNQILTEINSELIISNLGIIDTDDISNLSDHDIVLDFKDDSQKEKINEVSKSNLRITDVIKEQTPNLVEFFKDVEYLPQEFFTFKILEEEGIIDIDFFQQKKSEEDEESSLSADIMNHEVGLGRLSEENPVKFLGLDEKLALLENKNFQFRFRANASESFKERLNAGLNKGIQLVTYNRENALELAVYLPSLFEAISRSQISLDVDETDDDKREEEIQHQLQLLNQHLATYSVQVDIADVYDDVRGNSTELILTFRETPREQSELLHEAQKELEDYIQRNAEIAQKRIENQRKFDEVTAEIQAEKRIADRQRKDDELDVYALKVLIGDTDRSYSLRNEILYLLLSQLTLTAPFLLRREAA
ncbi:MAG: hypothetical protein Tsb0021_17630 [Chlamydiales bacterium]